jgi:hypothetical protein
MRPAGETLGLASAMADELEDFLLSAELFWPLSRRSAASEAPYPRLSLGSLSLTLDELTALEDELAGAQAAESRQTTLRIEALRTKWSAGMADKAARELRTRLDLWRAYLDDLDETPRVAEEYVQEVRQRVIISRLLGLAQSICLPPEATSRLQALDDRLMGRFRRSGFIWDARLQSVYPESKFWFLYGRPKAVPD